jgi:trigger factor
VKTDVEELSPTRVKLTIEVPFSELKASLDKAYREVSKQVRIPGFRPGHVPPRVIDQRLGRGVVLEQAVNDAVPQLYGKALEDNDVLALGQPDLEITQLDDGQQLAFTAEVDVRPRFELPDVTGLPVTVDNADVTPDEVEEYIAGLQERFASLRGVDRPAETGDYVSIDLSASVDGQPVDDAQASGLSYEVGSGSLLDGLDEALTGMSAGDAGTFTAELAGGEQAGKQADVAVTVHSVKVKELPELDDEFAQSASEYDTLGEFRAGTRTRLESVKRMQQAGQARDRALEALLTRIEIPLPERLVAEEIERREHSLDEQLERAGLTKDAYLASRDLTAEDLDAEIAVDARRFVKAGFVLDQIARTEELGLEQEELNAYVVEQAYRLGVPPDRLAKEIVDRGQLGVAVTEVLRSKALDLLAERATVTDEAGHEVDVKAIVQETAGGESSEAGPGGEAETADETEAGSAEATDGVEASDGVEATDDMEATDGVEASDGVEATDGMEATDGAEASDGARAADGGAEPDAATAGAEASDTAAAADTGAATAQGDATKKPARRRPSKAR